MKKKKKSVAGIIRRSGMSILERSTGEMYFRDFFILLKKRLRRRLRSDLILTSLVAIGSGFELHGGGESLVVALNGKYTGTLTKRIGRTKNKAKPKKEKVTPLQFIELAIKRLGKNGRLHTVISGFNDAFREYFPKKDPVAEVKKLVAEGKLFSRPSPRGVVISFAPFTDTKEALKKMGL